MFRPHHQAQKGLYIDFSFNHLDEVIIAMTISVTTFSNAQTGKVTLHSVEGNEISLDEHRGYPVVLIFDATWFPMANKSLYALQRLGNGQR
jgi:hypothetical protein